MYRTFLSSRSGIPGYTTNQYTPGPLRLSVFLAPCRELLTSIKRENSHVEPPRFIATDRIRKSTPLRRSSLELAFNTALAQGISLLRINSSVIRRNIASDSSPRSCPLFCSGLIYHFLRLWLGDHLLFGLDISIDTSFLFQTRIYHVCQIYAIYSFFCYTDSHVEKLSYR